MKRHATAKWNGAGKEGAGHLTSQSSVLDKTQYSFNSRFADGIGTNPEELVAAAHAGCFSMKLAFVLGGAGITPDSIETRCDITLDTAAGAVTHSHLTVRVAAAGIDQAKFDECVADAKANCPISKLLNAEISCEAELVVG